MECLRRHNRSIIQYSYLSLLIIFSSFEYFFRENFLTIGLNCIAICHFCMYYIRKVKFSDLKLCFGYILAVIIILLLQTISGIDKINSIIGFLIGSFGSIFIAYFLRNKLIVAFCNIITIIAGYSVIIYVLCLIPSIHDYLIGICDYFPSLNVKDAKIEGGGLNFIIYNFQFNYISEIIGFSRNCGPFWEPGMFAFFLNLALFFLLFLIPYNTKHRKLSITVLITALVSTFSTGGFLGGMILMILYMISHKKSPLMSIIFIPIGVMMLFAVFQLEYIGGKVNNQIENASYGSDESRFGAFLTQIIMIENSPIIGGEMIQDYSDSDTLASGTLLPLVDYGIPLGLFFFFLLYKSCRNISFTSTKSIKSGKLLFIFILVLSFSQTILLSSIIYLIFFYGLLNNNSNNKYILKSYEDRRSKYL